jgi:hypothetical protein
LEKQLIEEISDSVATLTFNRPDRLNALSTPIMEGLLEALPRLVGTITPIEAFLGKVCQVPTPPAAPPRRGAAHCREHRQPARATPPIASIAVNYHRLVSWRVGG